MPKQLPRLDHCLNCGAAVEGRFCTECGQENEDQTVALKLLVSDILSELVSFDAKIFRTLVPLLFRPGFLTNEYNEGKRVRYLSPLKLYLVTSVLFFLVLAWKTPMPRGESVRRQPAAGASGQAPRPPSAPGRKNGEAGGARRPDRPAVAAPGLRIGLDERTPISLDGRAASPEEVEQALKDPAKTKEIPPPVRFILSKALRVGQDPRAFLARFMDAVPRMMFFLLPLFAAMLKLLYLRRGRLYVEHVIFSLHCHAFVFIALMVEAVTPWGRVKDFLHLAMVLYLFFALKNVYRQSVGKTLAKLLLLSLGYLILFVLIFVATAALTLLTL
jgi:hypothetical protein